MSVKTAPLNVVIAHDDQNTIHTLTMGMKEIGHMVSGVYSDPSELIRHAVSLPTDLIVSGAALRDADATRALVEIGRQRPIPALLVTREHSTEVIEKALQDHVMAYLLEPVRRDELEPTVELAVRRFQQFEQLRNEVASLKQELADRKLIERAKGVLMRIHQLDEQEAYRRLRRAATDRRTRMAEVARQILADHSGEVDMPEDAI